MAAEATVVVRRILVTDAQGRTQLLVELDIQCEACGLTQGVIAGHHLATLHAAIGAIVEEHPELCGSVGVKKDAVTFQGVVDPGKIGWN